MKVLLLSTDKKIGEPGSEANRRIVSYGNVVDELHIIVYTLSSNGSERTKEESLGKNVFLHSVESNSLISLLKESIALGGKLIESDMRNRGVWLVSAQDPFETGFIGYRLKRRFNIPLQLQIHTDFLSPYFWRESLKNKIRVFVGKYLIKRADCVRVVSRRILESLKQNHVISPNIPVNVLPIIVSPLTDSSKNKPKENIRSRYSGYGPIILMASRLTREKGIDIGIEAFSKVLKRYPKSLLLIVGDGPELSKLKSRSQKFGRSVVFEPWRGNLTPYYAASDVFLLTSLYEGYGRTVVEAVLHGRPVVMTNVGCAGEIIKDGVHGRVVSAHDYRSIGKALLEVLDKKMVISRSVVGEFIGNLPDENKYAEALKHSWLSCAGSMK